jgi:type II secretory pathway pseudopilin PulG
MGNRSTPQLQEQVAQQSQQLSQQNQQLAQQNQQLAQLAQQNQQLAQREQQNQQLAQQIQQLKKNSIVEFLNQHCESIDEIICVLEQLHLDNYPSYHLRRKDSNDIVNATPSSYHASELGVQMNKFRRIHIQKCPNNLQIHVTRIATINYESLKTQLTQKYFQGNEQVFPDFIRQQSLILNQLRRAFYCAKCTKHHYNELSGFQPIFIMFLEGFLRKLSEIIGFNLFPATEVTPANDTGLSFDVPFYGDTNENTLISGFSDVFIQNEKFSTVAELKVPFSVLAGKSQFAALKDQLIRNYRLGSL